MAQINLDGLTSNSHKSKETAEKRATRVVNSKARIREKSLGTKFRETFIGEEVGEAKSYILFDVIVPAIKEMIVDTVENAVEMIFGVGGSGRRRSGKSRSSGESVSYTAYYKSKSDGDRRPVAKRDSDDRYESKEIIVDTRGEAEELLDVLMEHLDTYKKVSVGDLYDYMEKTPDFTDYKYGWTNLRNAYIKRVRDGYLLVLPRVIPLD